MFTRNPVLPNFIKALTMAVLVFSSALAVAGHHANDENKDEKIVELKEMTKQSEQHHDQAAEQLTDADTQAAEDALADEIEATAREMAEETDPIADE